MLKKILSICLAVILVAGLIPASVMAAGADAAESYSNAFEAKALGGFQFSNPGPDGYLYITGYKGFSKNLVLPKEHNGVKVYGIGARAFADNNRIESVVVPSTITSIGEEAFAECTKLSSVTVEEGVSEFDLKIFNGCTSLKNFTVPASVTSFNVSYDGHYDENGNYVEDVLNPFTGSSIENVIIKSERVPYAAFMNNQSIKTVKCEGVKVVDSEAFNGATNLVSVDLGNTLESIYSSAFENTGISSIVIPEGTKHIEYEAFKGSNLTEVTIPKSVETIYHGAFENCTKLKKAVVLAKAEELESNVFAGCTALESVTLSNNLNVINNGCFQNCTALKSIKLPESLGAIYNSAFENTGLAEISIPDGVGRIAGSVFKGCKNLSKVKLPALMDALYLDTFNGCTSLKSLVVPEGVVTIYGGALANTGIETLTIPGSVGTMSDDALANSPIKTLYCAERSAADIYAQQHNINTVLSPEIKTTSLTAAVSEITINPRTRIPMTFFFGPSNGTEPIIFENTNPQVAEIWNTFDLYSEAEESGSTVITVKKGDCSASIKVNVVNEYSEPVYLTQPEDFEGQVGDVAKFSSVVTFEGGMYWIQWQVSKDNGATWVDCYEPGYSKSLLQVKVTPEKANNLYRSAVMVAGGRDHEVALVAASNPAKLVAKADPNALSTPEIVSAFSRTQNSVKITWKSVLGADGYKLYRSENPNDGFKCVKTIKDPKATHYTNGGLTEGKTYYYKVQAYKVGADGKWVYSDFSTVDFMPAAVVFTNVYSNSTYRIRSLWDVVGGADGYQLWRADSPDGEYKIVKTINAGDVDAYSNTGLESGKNYSYKMRAYYTKPTGEKIFGAFSDVQTVAVMPKTPTVTVYSNGVQSARIKWNSISGAAGYQIWRADASGNYTLVKSVTDPTATGYTNRGLKSGEEYTYKVRAYTEVNGKKTFGAYSNPVNVTVK